jgi:hypothetical protein
VEEHEIWNSPMQSPAIIIEKVQEALKNAPEEFELTIKLRGLGAKKYNFISKVLEVGFGEPAENISQYLLRAGIEREISRILKAMSYLEDLSK